MFLEIQDSGSKSLSFQLFQYYILNIHHIRIKSNSGDLFILVRQGGCSGSASPTPAYRLGQNIRTRGLWIRNTWLRIDQATWASKSTILIVNPNCNLLTELLGYACRGFHEKAMSHMQRTMDKGENLIESGVMEWPIVS